jgi:hypothetical protein
MLITEIGMAQLPVLLYRLGASLTDLRRSVCGQYCVPLSHGDGSEARLSYKAAIFLPSKL